MMMIVQNNREETQGVVHSPKDDCHNECVELLKIIVIYRMMEFVSELDRRLIVGKCGCAVVQRNAVNGSEVCRYVEFLNNCIFDQNFYF